MARSAPSPAVILLILPHLIGAPDLADIETNVPSSLSHQFVTAVTMTSLVFWTLLGGLTSAVFALSRNSYRPAPTSRSRTVRAMAAGASSGIAKHELALISQRT
ncbi:hypothetical protein ACVWZ4_005864 [Bradyrhizobium sp. USDA 4472]